MGNDNEDIQEIEQGLSLWYSEMPADYDYGYSEGEEDAYEQCKQAMLDSGYAETEDEIDDDLINEWAWEQIDASYKVLVNKTNAILEKYRADYFDYFSFDFSSDYFGEGYSLNVSTDFPYSFDDEEERAVAYEEINKFVEMLEELCDIGWNVNYDDRYHKNLHNLIAIVAQIPIEDWNEPDGSDL